MNAGDGIYGSTIKWNLKNNAKHFDRVIIVDGALTDKAKEFYSQFPNLEYVDSPWKDSYVDQYKAFSSILEDGEWCLYLDCDEVPSDSLIEFCQTHQPREENIILLPCVLHITEDNTYYYAAEPDPLPTYKRQWTKHIFFKNGPTLDFRFFGSHVIPNHGENEKAIYVPKPYYHMKSLESFVYNDAWQAFLHPQGQGYDPVEAAHFKVFTKQYKTTKEFKEATRNGTWPPYLQKFAWEHAKCFDRPISRLAWVYWILEKHPLPPKNVPSSWDDVKNYVLARKSMELIATNKKNKKFIKVE